MAVTLRVYDAGKKYEHYVDRYSLYYPTPRDKVKEWGYMGMYLGFSFSKGRIIKCSRSECKKGVGIDFFGGRKVKRETLPIQAQKWINKLEKAYNKAINENTEEAWEEFYNM